MPIVEELRAAWPGLKVYVELDDSDVLRDSDGEEYRKLTGLRIEFDQANSPRVVHALVRMDTDTLLDQELTNSVAFHRALTPVEQRYEKGLSIQLISH
jgi:hypothetical protein